MDQQSETSLIASYKKTEAYGSSPLTPEARARVCQALVRMEAFFQAKLTENERTAYLEFLETLHPEVMEEAVENAILQFRPERTRLPLPAEFLEFCPEIPKSQREQEELRRARWRLEYEMENRDGSVDRAREEFRRKLKTLIRARNV